MRRENWLRLLRYLQSRNGERVLLTFNEIQDASGGLLEKSAKEYPPYWQDAGRDYSQMLSRAGYKASLTDSGVLFSRGPALEGGKLIAVAGLQEKNIRRNRGVIEGDNFLFELVMKHYGLPDRQSAIEAAILETTYFIHPDVVRHTECLPILRARRVNEGERRHSLVGEEFVSDNFPPDYVFRAAMAERREQGSTHLCHIYSKNREARDTFFYTNLANLCLMPSFLAKLADTNNQVVEFLKECSYSLFGFDPYGIFVGRAPRIQPANIKTATPRLESLDTYLGQGKNKGFLQAKKAGYLFDQHGRVNRNDPWVNKMIDRRPEG